MKIPRVHAFEFVDLPGFPDSIRRMELDFIRTADTLGWPYEPVIQPLCELLERQRGSRIVDLGSGRGGPLPRIASRVAQALGRELEVVLTDTLPHPEVLPIIGQLPGIRLRYHPEPVDAGAVPADLTGVRTMCSGFHHLRPEAARIAVADAVAARSPLVVIEPQERRWESLLLLASLYPAGMLLAPFIRPFSAARVALAWGLPVFPAVLAFDGVVSGLRIYRPEELAALWDPPPGWRFWSGARFSRGAFLNWGVFEPPP